MQIWESIKHASIVEWLIVIAIIGIIATITIPLVLASRQYEITLHMVDGTTERYVGRIRGTETKSATTTMPVVDSKGNTGMGMGTTSYQVDISEYVIALREGGELRIPKSEVKRVITTPLEESHD